MKKFISVMVFTLFTLHPVFAEDLGKFKQLEADVDSYIDQFQTDQANVKNSKSELDAAQSAVNALEDQLKGDKNLKDGLKQSRRKLDRADRVAKDDIKDLVSSSEEIEKAKIKLSEAKLKLQAAQVKFEESAKKTKNADELFFRKIQTFKAREKKLLAFVDSKNKAVGAQNKAAKETDEPATLRDFLSQSPNEFLKVIKGEKSDAQASAVPAAAVTPEAAAAAATTTATVGVSPPGTITTPATGPVLGSGTVKLPTLASAPVPLSKCDQAKLDLTSLILKDKANSQILSNMVTLAALKMAYHMTGDKTHLLSLESYSQKSISGLKSGEFKTKLTDFYSAQGEAIDESKINRIFTQPNVAYQSSLRMDNGSSSALLLYLSESAAKEKLYPFTKEDAAAVWAQSQIFVAKNYEIGRKKADDGESQNRLNFSTQVYRLLNSDADATEDNKKIATRNPAELAKRIDNQEAQIKTAIETSIKSMKQDQIGCFQDKEVADCKPEELKLGTEKLSEIKRNLASAVSKGVLNSSKSTSTSPVKIDLLNSTAKDGIIDLKLAP